MRFHPALAPFLEYHLLECEHGLWCLRCMLPSASRVRWALIDVRDPSRWLVEIVANACHDCGVTTWENKRL